MTEKKQKNNIILAILVFIFIAVIVAVIGFFIFEKDEEIIQGEVEVSEYRVSSKVPGRILKLYVKEGDYVHVGDTLAILDAPEVYAKKVQALGAENAAAAMSNMATNGARTEQKQGAYDLWKQAEVAQDIAKKSYERVQRLFEEGVITAQKRDEVEAQYRAAEYQCAAAKSQYKMAENGSRAEERQAAAANVNRAQGAVQEVNSYLGETVQIAKVDGEISGVYLKEGELAGTGSPIMSISVVDDVWGTFNVREDYLHGLKVGDMITAFMPAFNKTIELKVFYIKDLGSYAVWKAVKSTGGYDIKTFEVKARPIKKQSGLRPGMSLVIKDNGIKRDSE